MPAAKSKEDENKVNVTATKTNQDVDDAPQADEPQVVAGPDGAEENVDRDETNVTGEREVTANKEASDPFIVSNVDPTDPNGYNNAPRAAEGFIANPVAGGGIPADPDADVVNGITQSDPEVEDLPEENVDPKGLIKQMQKVARGNSEDNRQDGVEGRAPNRRNRR